MIRVTNLTKRFSGYTAVDNLSFEVNRGEIIGFLGPNGAGKTTTMRMLTGFLHPTRGQIEIGGHDVIKDPLEARRHIGYMPESCPLYTEMRVDEYLKFRAHIKDVPRRNLKNRLGTVKELCGLGHVGRRIIGQLSKGYRQRVGLADSLLNEPDLLILDEPTAGLDPNQIREVRELIGRLAERHTLLLSTHILPEVEMACQRVLIIDKGRLVASDTPASLQRRLMGNAQVRADIRGDAAAVRTALQAIEAVEAVAIEPRADGWLQCTVDSPDPDIRPRLFECVVSNRWQLRELHQENRSLEDLFVTITRGQAPVENS